MFKTFIEGREKPFKVKVERFFEALKFFRSMSSLEHQTLEDFASVETFVERRQKPFKVKVESPF